MGIRYILICLALVGCERELPMEESTLVVFEQDADSASIESRLPDTIEMEWHDREYSWWEWCRYAEKRGYRYSILVTDDPDRTDIEGYVGAIIVHNGIDFDAAVDRMHQIAIEEDY